MSYFSLYNSCGHTTDFYLGKTDLPRQIHQKSPEVNSSRVLFYLGKNSGKVQGAIGRRASTKRRALFASEADLALSTGEEVTNVDPEPKPLLKTRDACTQTEPPFANTEEKSSSVDVSNFLALEIFTTV